MFYILIEVLLEVLLETTVPKIRKAIEKMKEQGKLTHEGPDKGGRWVVHDDIEE